ncbi:MAG: response regulator [Fimbriimonadaceae bacterium]|nr:response regulator [Fimbriimonadaceae bacterium]
MNRILLVEDNPDEEKLALRALRQGGHADHVHVVRDGHEAIEYLERLEASDPEFGLPRLVLLDLKLPKVSGLDVLRRFRKSAVLREVPIVVCSSSDEESDVSQSYRLGANGYIRKPVDYDEFIQVIRHVGEQWLSERPS